MLLPRLLERTVLCMVWAMKAFFFVALVGCACVSGCGDGGSKATGSPSATPSSSSDYLSTITKAEHSAVKSVDVSALSKAIQMFQHQSHPPPKLLRWRDEAYYQIPIIRKIVKVAGMHQYALLLKQCDGEIFVRLRDGDTQHRVPSAFHLQAGAGLLFRELAVKLFQVGAQAVEEQRLDAATLVEQNGRA